jgi:Aspartyl/Asparaginyl beta-hydroxylase
MKNAVECLNFKVDLNQLRSYYNELKASYQEYNWSYMDNPEDIRDDIYNFNNQYNKKRNAFGWAITVPEILSDNKKVVPWTNIHKDFVYGSEHLATEKQTPMVFGIIKKLMEIFPYAKQVSLTVFVPGAHIVPHKDEDYLIRVHIPIYTSKDAKWLTWNGYQPLDEVGQAYLCDTRDIHSVYNDGDSDRVHLLFAIESQYEEHIKSITGIIKTDE